MNKPILSGKEVEDVINNIVEKVQKGELKVDIMYMDRNCIYFDKKNEDGDSITKLIYDGKSTDSHWVETIFFNLRKKLYSLDVLKGIKF